MNESNNHHEFKKSNQMVNVLDYSLRPVCKILQTIYTNLVDLFQRLITDNSLLNPTNLVAKLESQNS